MTEAVNLNIYKTLEIYLINYISIFSLCKISLISHLTKHFYSFNVNICTRIKTQTLYILNLQLSDSNYNVKYVEL